MFVRLPHSTVWCCVVLDKYFPRRLYLQSACMTDTCLQEAKTSFLHFSTLKTSMSTQSLLIQHLFSVNVGSVFKLRIWDALSLIYLYLRGKNAIMFEYVINIKKKTKHRHRAKKLINASGLLHLISQRKSFIKATFHRITEWLSLQGISGDLLLQNFCSSRDTQN